MVRPKMTEEERKARKKAYRENHKEERDAYDRVYQEYHKEERKASHRDYSQRLRREAFASYGGFKCNCPGGCDVTDPKFLSLDHKKERRLCHLDRLSKDVICINFIQILLNAGHLSMAANPKKESPLLRVNG